MSKQKLYHVKPAVKGLKVPNPATKAHLPEGGEVVEWSSYWQRRFDSKEVERTEVKEETKPVDSDKVKSTKDGGK